MSRAHAERPQPGVLIADDNRDAADTLALCLQLDGHRVIVAYDGLSAIEQATREQPQVLLLDIGMPVLNGYEVARRIRQQDWGRQARLVALTGGGVDWAHAQAAGFDSHVLKPVDPAVLSAWITSGDLPKNPSNEPPRRPTP